MKTEQELTIFTNNTKTQLVKDTICKGLTDDEFEMFKEVCSRTRLNPFLKQIQPVKRWDKNLNRNVMTIQTGIDGYRLIADRTGKYAPGREPTFTYDPECKLISSTAYVMKQTQDGHWHEVAATAFFSEYCATKKDGTPNNFWETKPHIMLAKCAEALAIRKAFPADFTQLYTKEEMEQAEEITMTPKVTEEEVVRLLEILELCGEEYKEEIEQSLRKHFKVSSFFDLQPALYNRIMDAAHKKHLEMIKNTKVNEMQKMEEDHENVQ